MLDTARPKPLRQIKSLAPELLTGDKIQLGHSLFGLIWINSNRVSGGSFVWLSRVPIQNLFESLAAGETLDDFLDGFEGVSREQALEVLELAGKDLLSDLQSL